MAFDVRAIPLLKRIFGYRTGAPPEQIGPTPPSELQLASEAGLGEYYRKEMELATDRQAIYDEMDLMDMDDIINVALDLIAEDATQIDLDRSQSLWVEEGRKEVKTIINELFKVLEVEDEIFAVARELAKYGDSFSAIYQVEKSNKQPGGIVSIVPRQPKMMYRYEDSFRRLEGFSFGEKEDKDSRSSPWEYIHFRLRGKDRNSCYGTSMMAPARRAFRRLKMMEDAMAIYRIKRAPDRLVFNIQGLDALSTDERVETFNKIRQQLSKKQLMDPATGQVRSEVQPWNIDHNIYVDADSLKIDQLRGSTNAGSVLDIDYARKRLFGLLKIPPDYLGFSEAAGGFLAQSPLSSQDIQFGRQIKRLQRALLQGYTRLIQIHMAWLGIDPSLSQNEFTLGITPVTFLDEMQRAQLLQVKATVLGILSDIGRALEVDKAKLIPYFLKISGLPYEIWGPDREDGPGDALSGSIDIVDSMRGNGKVKDLIREMDKVIREAGINPVSRLLAGEMFRQQMRSSESSKKEPLPVNGE